ncbi:MAG: hypothetical protein ACREHD_34750, partial [Pirellulales bacterium]
AYGDIRLGSITATASIGSVESAHDITATITAPSVGTVDKFDPSIMSNYPTIPDTSLAGIWAELNADQAAVQAGASLMALAEISDTLALAAGAAAASDEFQVSMGTPQQAQAAMQEAVNQLNVSITELSDAAQKMVAAAQDAQQTTWSAITSQAETAQAAFLDELVAAAVEADKEKLDLLDMVALNKQLADTGQKTAAKERQAVLAERDDYRDHQREKDFDADLLQLQIQYAHGWFFAASFVADKVPVYGWLLDVGLGVAEAALFGYEQKWGEAGLTLVFAVIPFVSRASFSGAQAEAKAIGELNTLAKTANTIGDAGNLAFRAGSRSAIDVASTVAGSALRHCPLPDGCFAAGTAVWIAGLGYSEDNAVEAGAPVVRVAFASWNDFFWSVILVGVGIAIQQASQRRAQEASGQRQRAKALKHLFGRDDDSIVDVHNPSFQPQVGPATWERAVDAIWASAFSRAMSRSDRSCNDSLSCPAVTPARSASCADETRRHISSGIRTSDVPRAGDIASRKSRSAHYTWCRAGFGWLVISLLLALLIPVGKRIDFHAEHPADGRASRGGRSGLSNCSAKDPRRGVRDPSLGSHSVSCWHSAGWDGAGMRGVLRIKSGLPSLPRRQKG